MKGKERILAVLKGKTPDRIPVFPNIHWGTAHFSGRTIKEFATDGKKNAECLLAAYKMFGYDGVQIASDVAIEGEAVGNKVLFPDDSIPSVIEPVLREPDTSKLKLPDPHSDGRMPVIIEATQIVVREVGDDAFIESTLAGPMNCAGQIRGIENLMMDFYQRPDFVKELLDFTVELGIKYGKALINAGADCIGIGEALCSPNVISPMFYRDFVRARQKKLVDALFAHGVENVILHICGDINKILVDCAATDANIFDIDWMVDMAEVLEIKEIKEANIVLRGNLNPTGVMLSDNPEDVLAQAKKLMESLKGKGRFILSSGCNITNSVSEENMHALVKAAEMHGRCTD